MAYQSITQHNATFFHSRPPGHRYAGICIHWWGSPADKPTFEGTIQYLVYGGARHTASVHYVAEAGRVACLLDPDTQLSWGQGDGAHGLGNNYFISIECNPRASNADYQTTSELIRDLRAVYGNLPLRPHNAFTATQCPGVWDLARLDRLARSTPAAPAPTKPAPTKPASSTPPAKVTKPPAPDRNRIHWVVERGDTLSKIAAYFGGPTVQQIAAHNRIHPNAVLKVGQAIYIPGPLIWIVESGDTLGKIAAYYGMTPQVVAQKNGISVNTTIHPGQRLVIL